jgi:brefeldin A-resistance guanine nucleotide exchange factor 1
LTAETTATFFANSSHLSKTIIGDYIGRKENEEVLVEYVKKYSFEGKRIDEALRVFLEKFRLPGESQMIDRIILKFSIEYFKIQNENRFVASEDAVYILAFSIIMLNTDLHNPQNPRRMTFEDFCRNLRGTNDGENFAAEYLQAIYIEIRDNEIILPEEHGGDLGFNFEWKQLSDDFHKLPKLKMDETNVFDKDLFSNVWKPVVAAIFYSFENLEDSAALQKILDSLHYCSVLGAKYGKSEILDQIVLGLLRISGISYKSKILPLEYDLTLSDEEILARRGDNVDKWAVDFGQNFRAQVAVVFVFDIVSEFADFLKESWPLVFLYLIRLLKAPVISFYTNYFRKK